MKRRQEAAEAEERARKEKEEAERLAAQAAAQPKEIEEVTSDRPDSSTTVVDERPGKTCYQLFQNHLLIQIKQFMTVNNKYLKEKIFY